MEEKEKNEGIKQDEQQVAQSAPTEETAPRGRAALRSRYKEAYPDEDFDGMDDDAFADRVSSDMDAQNDKIKRYEDNDAKLTELFEKNPQSAQFLMDMADGKDFLQNISDNFGEGIIEALNDPEKLEELSRSNKKKLEQAAAEKDYEDKWERAMVDSLTNLQQATEEGEYSEDEVQQGMELYDQLVGSYIDGNISKELFDAVMRAVRYKQDVESARREGEVEGRNANINESLRKRNASNDGLPSLGGQSNRNAAGMRFNRSGINGENTGSNIWKAGGFKRNNYE